MRGTLRECAAITAVILAGAVAAGCSKTNDYAADTSAAMSRADTMAPSSSAGVAQDTATTATASKSTPKKATAKKAPAKKAPTTPSY